jgi:hypothetical protein
MKYNGEALGKLSKLISLFTGVNADFPITIYFKDKNQWNILPLSSGSLARTQHDVITDITKWISWP